MTSREGKKKRLRADLSEKNNCECLADAGETANGLFPMKMCP